MKDSAKAYIDSLVERYPDLDTQKEAIIKSVEILIESYRNGGKLLCNSAGL